MKLRHILSSEGRRGGKLFKNGGGGISRPGFFDGRRPGEKKGKERRRNKHLLRMSRAGRR